MKTTYLTTIEQLATLPWLKFADRDRGQLEQEQPPVLFPCALISISQPKRQTLSTPVQRRTTTITIRLAFERLFDSSSLAPQNNRAKALEYYDRVSELDNMFNGLRNAHFAQPWECTTTIEEQRPDLDVVRFVFATSLVG